ncbi:serine/threonine-protein phosphatase 2A activator, partial [Enteropsectra breve]
MMDKNYRKNPNVDFTETEAYRRIKEFLLKIDHSVKTEEQKEPAADSTMQEISTMQQISELVESTPLSKDPARFANLAMRDVIGGIEKITTSEHLRQAFGNPIRLDFGTGHELNFLCYLYERHSDENLKINEAFCILKEYFRTARRYIKKFNIEAAGARGCWSVDDYLLLPYILG